MNKNADLEPVLIAGTGAMACLFAARLAASGRPVRMLGSWPGGLEALQRQGVRLVLPGGDQVAYPVHASSDPQDFLGTRLALVLVKAWQTGETARRLAACLDPGGIALTLQNGLGNRELLAAVLGEDRAAAGVTTAGASLLGPGCVLPGGEGPMTLGRHPRLEPLSAALSRAGFEVQTGEDLEPLLWGKLVINAAINPLTALLEVPNGALLERPAARRLLGALAMEAADVASALGVTLPYTDPVARVEEVARRTASNRSSMLQDLQRGAPTEIDAINGSVASLAGQSGTAAPLNWSMWQLVKAKAGNGAAHPFHPEDIENLEKT